MKRLGIRFITISWVAWRKARSARAACRETTKYCESRRGCGNKLPRGSSRSCGLRERPTQRGPHRFFGLGSKVPVARQGYLQVRKGLSCMHPFHCRSLQGIPDVILTGHQQYPLRLFQCLGFRRSRWGDEDRARIPLWVARRERFRSQGSRRIADEYAGAVQWQGWKLGGYAGDGRANSLIEQRTILTPLSAASFARNLPFKRDECAKVLRSRGPGRKPGGVAAAPMEIHHHCIRAVAGRGDAHRTIAGDSDKRYGRGCRWRCLVPWCCCAICCQLDGRRSRWRESWLRLDRFPACTPWAANLGPARKERQHPPKLAEDHTFTVQKPSWARCVCMRQARIRCVNAGCTSDYGPR